MAVHHILSHVSLFSVLLWTFLYVNAFIGRRWVVVELDLGLQGLISQMKNPSQHGSGIDDIIKNYLPSGTLTNIVSSVPLDENVAVTLKVSLNAGFQQSCMDLKADYGGMKAVQAVVASVCVENDLYNNPKDYGLPSTMTASISTIFDDLNKGKVSMIAGLFFTALAVVISLMKPCLLKWKSIQYILNWVIVAASLISLICAGSAIGYATKNQNHLEDELGLFLSQTGPGFSSFYKVDRTGGSIYCTAIGIVASIVVAAINVVEFCLLKRRTTGPNYNNFDMSA